MPRIATVSYLNARPLVDGLERETDVEIVRDVPSGLLAALEDGRAEIALCPVIDFQRSRRRLEIVPAGAIGCDGPALTVKLFSRVRFERLESIEVDRDSHTSAALVSIVVRRLFGVNPEIVPHRRPPAETAPDAVLLIGDKVIHDPPDPAVFDRTLDLGAAWKKLTGRPFVFAAWMAPAGAELGDLPARLDRRRVANHGRLRDIAAAHAAVNGWPEELAAEYLSRNLRYELGERELDAVEAFWRLCREHGLIDELRPMRLVGGVSRES